MALKSTRTGRRAASLSFKLLFLTTPRRKLPTPRPLVVWHGLGTHLYYDMDTEEHPIDVPSVGDTYTSPGMLEFMQLIKEIHNDIFVCSVYLDVDPTADQRAGVLAQSPE